MTDDPTRRDSGAKHEGPQRTAPYPMSRLAPVHDLVDVARQIAEADTLLGVSASAELSQIAEQIRSLQARAQLVLEKTARNLELHQAECSFAKKPGQVVHLYERASGRRFLSRVGPAEWETLPGAFRGTYRIELDQSFTRLDEGEEGADPRVPASALVAKRLLGT